MHARVNLPNHRLLSLLRTSISLARNTWWLSACEASSHSPSTSRCSEAYPGSLSFSVSVEYVSATRFR